MFRFYKLINILNVFFINSFQLQCISIDKLSDKLNLSEEEAERWIVNLIRVSPFKLDAKIDSKLGHVLMEMPTVSPYEQVMAATKLSCLFIL